MKKRSILQTQQTARWGSAFRISRALGEHCSELGVKTAWPFRTVAVDPRQLLWQSEAFERLTTLPKSCPIMDRNQGAGAAPSEMFSDVFTCMSPRWNADTLGPWCSLNNDRRVFYNYQQAVAPARYNFWGTRGQESLNPTTKAYWRVQVIKPASSAAQRAVRLCAVGMATDEVLRRANSIENLFGFGENSVVVYCSWEYGLWDYGVFSACAKHGKNYLPPDSRSWRFYPTEQVSATLAFIFNGPKSEVHVALETADNIEILWSEKWAPRDEVWPFVCAADQQSCGEAVEVVLCPESQLSPRKIRQLNAIFKGRM